MQTGDVGVRSANSICGDPETTPATHTVTGNDGSQFECRVTTDLILPVGFNGDNFTSVRYNDGTNAVVQSSRVSEKGNTNTKNTIDSTKNTEAESNSTNVTTLVAPTTPTKVDEGERLTELPPGLGLDLDSEEIHFQMTPGPATPCECVPKCAPRYSDTPHGSHGFCCDAVYMHM